MARTGVVDSSGGHRPVLPDLELSRARHDRCSEIRTDATALLRLLTPRNTDILVVRGSARGAAVPVRADGSGLVLVPGDEVTGFGSLVSAVVTPNIDPAAGVSPFDASRDPVVVLHGTLDGRALISVVEPAASPAATPGEPSAAADVPDLDGVLPADVRWAGLRDIGADLPDGDMGVAVEAIGLANWHRAHPRCPLCGNPTVPVAGGHERRCPADASSHHPRSDPAVIMMVLDPADRLLLARQAVWPHARYSVLAGFVEPGESLEATVVRETREESGIEVPIESVEYLGSQPWPFPASLMVGFVARATTTEITVDGTEIAEAFWVSRDELDARLAEGSLGLPPVVSIARRMIEWWAGGPLPDGIAWG